MNSNNHSSDEVYLVVDLDGTLIKSDSLYECLWDTLSNNLLKVFRIFIEVLRGKPAVKRYLANEADIDAVNLPYNSRVIDYIRDWRDGGGKTALVTAADQKVANKIAGNVGLFDEVHGSDGRVNLKGKEKAQFLTDRFGKAGFIYIGDSESDIPVWEAASHAVAVGASRKIRKILDGAERKVEYLPGRSGSWKAFLKALRFHQWSKNVLVFLPMLAAHAFSGDTVIKSVLAFVSFCAIASGVYLVNDLLDLKSDRMHPRKQNRPLASGNLSIIHGTLLAPMILLLGTLIAASLGWPFLAVMIGYLIATTAYSVYFKRRAIIDICVLSGLYTVRILAGAAASEITLSVWLLAFSIFIFFSLAAVKRQAELIDGTRRGVLKSVGRGYYIDDLPIISQFATAAGFVSVLVLALYLNSPSVSLLYPFPYPLWGICLVLLFWINRTILITHRGHMEDDPIVFAAKDRISHGCFVLIGVLLLIGTTL